MRDQSTPKKYPSELPIMPDISDIQLKLIGKKIRATKQEIDKNTRSRSATLRVAERFTP
jgi:16S rRNA (cytosine1402-N4)-methyltransferase